MLGGPPSRRLYWIFGDTRFNDIENDSSYLFLIDPIISPPLKSRCRIYRTRSWSYRCASGRLGRMYEYGLVSLLRQHGLFLIGHGLLSHLKPIGPKTHESQHQLNLSLYSANFAADERGWRRLCGIELCKLFALCRHGTLCKRRITRSLFKISLGI